MGNLWWEIESRKNVPFNSIWDIYFPWEIIWSLFPIFQSHLFWDSCEKLSKVGLADRAKSIVRDLDLYFQFLVNFLTFISQNWIESIASIKKESVSFVTFYQERKWKFCHDNCLSCWVLIVSAWYGLVAKVLAINVQNFKSLLKQLRPGAIIIMEKQCMRRISVWWVMIISWKSWVQELMSKPHPLLFV